MMRNLQRWLGAVTAMLAALALLCAFLFYDGYWQHSELFDNNGRYFDSETTVVYHDTSFYWAPMAIILAGLSCFAYRYLKCSSPKS